MKQKILDNVTEYSANQLVEYIRTGVVTFDELIQDTDGEFSVEEIALNAGIAIFSILKASYGIYRKLDAILTSLLSASLCAIYNLVVSLLRLFTSISN